MCCEIGEREYTDRTMARKISVAGRAVRQLFGVRRIIIPSLRIIKGDWIGVTVDGIYSGIGNNLETLHIDAGRTSCLLRMYDY